MTTVTHIARRTAASAIAALCVTALLGASLGADAPKKPPVSYVKEIKPFFEDHCLGCHRGSGAKHGLCLDTPEHIMEGGDQGPPIVAGKADESLIVKYLTGARSPQMPPNEKISEEKVNLVRRWIDEGAKFDVPKDPPKK